MMLRSKTRISEVGTGVTWCPGGFRTRYMGPECASLCGWCPFILEVASRTLEVDGKTLEVAGKTLEVSGKICKSLG